MLFFRLKGASKKFVNPLEIAAKFMIKQLFFIFDRFSDRDILLSNNLCYFN